MHCKEVNVSAVLHFPPSLIYNSAMLTILASATGCCRLCLVGVLYIKTPTRIWEKHHLKIVCNPFELKAVIGKALI